MESPSGNRLRGSDGYCIPEGSNGPPILDQDDLRDAAPQGLSDQWPEDWTKDMQTRVGIIGLGSMGILHAAILGSLDDVSIAAVADADSRLLKLVSRLLPTIAFFEDSSRMLREIGPDAVVICTPANTHVDLARAVLETLPRAGLLIEKPLSNTPGESAKLADEFKDRVVMVGYQRRFTGTFAKAHALVSAGAIGKPAYFRARQLAAGVMTSGMSGWRFAPETGGATRELGAHIIDLLVWFFGSPESVLTKGARIFSEIVDDSTHSVLAYAGGMYGTLDIGWSERGYRPAEMRIEIVGKLGSLDVTEDQLTVFLNKQSSVPGEYATKTEYVHSLTPPIPILIGAPENVLEDMAFLDCIREKRAPSSNLNSAARVDELIGRMLGQVQMTRSSGLR